MPHSMLVDFHCHLDLYPDFEAAVAECEREAVYTLAVTTTPRAWQRKGEVASKTKYVRAALGLHPQLVAEHEIDLWERLLPQARYVGEVGIDAGPRFYKSLEAQRRVFERVLKACAKDGTKILTIHSVRAVKAVLDMIEANLPEGRGTPVLHWFTGTGAEAKRAACLGCYFCVNASMLGDEKRRALVAALPPDRLLTQTDGPFTLSGDRPSRPQDVADTVVGLAHLHGTRPSKWRRRSARTCVLSWDERDADSSRMRPT